MASLPHRLRVLELLAESTRPLHVAEIAGRLAVDQTLTPGLTAMLDDLVLNGAVRAFPGHRYRIAEGVASVEREGGGRKPTRERLGFLTVNPRGFGFVASPGTGESDVYVSPEMLGGAMHGDQVTVRIIKTSSRGQEGEIVRVVKRASKRVPGLFRRRGRSAWLEPDDARMRSPIPIKNIDVDARDGQAVVVQLTHYPESREELPEGEVVAVLGEPGDPQVEIAKVLVREEIHEDFPQKAVEEARAYGTEIDPVEVERREDLRPIPLLTIDPVDARDHDDAVYVRRAGEHDPPDAAWVAWVAIADVSFYVKPGTALDEEARRRGCSVYLPDRAIPMLPRELSSHLCSLLAEQDRLCLAVEVALDATGTPIKRRFVEGVMRNRAKLSYEDVARALKFTSDEPPSAVAKKFLPELEVAWEAATALRSRRMRRGALDFDLPEPKVILDENGIAKDVVRARKDPGVKKAYNLIEELMLLGNEVVAEELTHQTVPTVYRVHGTPDETKLDRFATLAESLGMPFDPEHAKDPKALGKFLRVIATHPQAGVLNTLLLRAMKQATYDVVNIGHFGLASQAYLHFTSPIRRYPDLVVHRAVHQLCQGKQIARDEQAMEALKEAALTASQAERKAMDVEREVVDLHRALLMRAHIGENFEGTVSALVGSGAYVALDEPYVDVLVRYESMGNEPYELDEEGLSAVGQRSGDVVRLGDRMMVRIDDVSIERRTVLATRLASMRVQEDDGRPRTHRRGQGHGDVRDKKLAQRRGRAEAENARRGKKTSAKPSKTGGTSNAKSSHARPERGRPESRAKSGKPASRKGTGKGGKRGR